MQSKQNVSQKKQAPKEEIKISDRTAQKVSNSTKETYILQPQNQQGSTQKIKWSDEEIKIRAQKDGSYSQASLIVQSKYEEYKETEINTYSIGGKTLPEKNEATLSAQQQKEETKEQVEDVKEQIETQNRPGEKTEYKLAIHQLDVGQGDSALILFNKLNRQANSYEIYKSMLLDGGCAYNKASVKKYIASKLKGSESTKKLDSVILSHNEGGHRGGLPVRKYSIQDISNGLTRYIHHKEGNISLGQKQGDEYYFHACHEKGAKETWETLFVGPQQNNELGHNHGSLPDKDALSIECVSSGAGDSNENNNSLAFVIKNYGFSFFTGGDLKGKVEDVVAEKVKQKYKNISAMKTSHHGSKDSSSEGTLKALDSIVALNSNGDRHDHPNLETLQRLRERVTHTYMTNPWRALGSENYSKSQFIAERESRGKFTIAGDKSVTLASGGDKVIKGHLILETREKLKSAKAGFFTVSYQQKIGPQLHQYRDYYHGYIGELQDAIKTVKCDGLDKIKYNIGSHTYFKNGSKKQGTITVIRSLGYVRRVAKLEHDDITKAKFNHKKFSSFMKDEGDNKENLSVMKCLLEKNLDDLCFIHANVQKKMVSISLKNIKHGSVSKKYSNIEKKGHEQINLLSRRVIKVVIGGQKLQLNPSELSEVEAKKEQIRTLFQPTVQQKKPQRCKSTPHKAHKGVNFRA